MLVSIDQLNESANRYKEWENKSGREEAVTATEEELVKSINKAIPDSVAKGNMLGAAENMVKRKEMIREKAAEPAEFAFERAIGKNDSVYSNFVELIADSKKKVGRVVVKEGAKVSGYATGFMVSDSLLLTNWHVFNAIEDVAQSEVQFYYEYDMAGRPGRPVTFRLQAAVFFHSFKELDYCFVAVEQKDVTGAVLLSSIGYIYLDPTLGKLGNEEQELLNIIHHPSGDFKQLSIRENKFKKIMATTIWYESDTAQGSSGSPVFNDQWQIVALHHMGVPDTTPDGKNYLDKDGNIIPQVNGKVDVSKIHWVANEGIRISVILKDIFKQFPDSSVINGLRTQPPAFFDRTILSDKNKSINEQPEKTDSNMNTSNNSKVEISFPASLMDASGNVTISINNRAGIDSAAAVVDNKAVKPGTSSELTEIKKVDKENAVDFSDCVGYLPNFMGKEIKLPQPKKILEKQIAKLSSGKMELKYFKYSVLFNAITKMPALSAINVEGNPEKRLDNSKRSDDWLRDKRIDIDAQLTDKFYAASGFDKGHMSRFEDANWDDSEEKALRNGIYTCFYTNACPQVLTLNRGGGLWGKLEKAVLEKGVKKEEGKLGRITVFNGPVFSAAKDRVFRGETIPMEFFKIIVWRNDNEEIKATAFKLSQEDLVKGIKFTESFDMREEAIDIDTNETFKEYQCSIKSLTKDTKIDFSELDKYDTYDKANTDEAMLISSEEDLESLISSNNKGRK